MKNGEKDLITDRIKKYYSENGNFDFEGIKESFLEEDKIFMEDLVLKKRIAQIENENFASSEK
jgi:hypothetical protein